MTAPPAPVRNGWRDGRARTCPLCPAPLPSARARYCSPACRQRAFRLRQAPRPNPDEPLLRAALRRQGQLGAHTVYECPTCGERVLGQQRCEDCGVFGRAVGLGGPCPHCDEPVLLTDLLPPEVLR
jgi:ribosomal protein L32